MGRRGLSWLTARVGRVPLLVVALAVAAALATAAIAPLPERASPFTGPWWLLAGLFFDRPVTVVLACLLGSAVALTLHRRQSPLKLAFNLGNFTLGAAVAVAL